MTLRERLEQQVRMIRIIGAEPIPPDDTAGYSEEEWGVILHMFETLLALDKG